MVLLQAVVRGQVQDVLHLERRQLRVLGPNQRAPPGHVRGGEAVACRMNGRAAGPRDLDADSGCEELDGRRRIVEERVPILELVAADREDGGELPGEAL